jgi:hypothetical protein|tara:strand:+ start:340 stop:627 length:288 start_codon:yes stop_codon:yes gene_type:complete
MVVSYFRVAEISEMEVDWSAAIQTCSKIAEDISFEEVVKVLDVFDHVFKITTESAYFISCMDIYYYVGITLRNFICGFCKLNERSRDYIAENIRD